MIYAIMRKFSGPIARLISKTSITPNQITLFRIFVISFFASLFFAQEDYFSSLIGLFLSYSVAFLDFVDGDLARKKSLESKFGDWLDHKLAEPIVGTFILLGLSVKLIKSSDNLSTLILVVLTVVTYIFAKTMLTVYEHQSGLWWEDIDLKLKKYFTTYKVKSPFILSLIFTPMPWGLLFMMGFWVTFGVFFNKIFYSFIIMCIFFSLRSFCMLGVFKNWINDNKDDVLVKALLSITHKKKSL